MNVQLLLTRAFTVRDWFLIRVSPWYWRMEWRTWKEKFFMAIVWKLPRVIIYWATVRLAADYSVSDTGEVGALRILDALNWWDK